MKYVVLEGTVGRDLRYKVPVVFPNIMVHADVAAVMTMALERMNWTKIKAVSAGEYNPMEGTCSGKSATLKLASRGEEDADLIRLNDYGIGAT